MKVLSCTNLPGGGDLEATIRVNGKPAVYRVIDGELTKLVNGPNGRRQLYARVREQHQINVMKAIRDYTKKR